jgi:hypothetical protein
MSQSSIREYIQQQVILRIQADGGTPHASVAKYLEEHPEEARDLAMSAGEAAIFGVGVKVGKQLRGSMMADRGEDEIAPSSLEPYLPGFELAPTARLLLVNPKIEDWQPVSKVSESQVMQHYAYAREQHHRGVAYNDKRYEQHKENCEGLEAKCPGSSNVPRGELRAYLQQHLGFDETETEHESEETSAQAAR